MGKKKGYVKQEPLMNTCAWCNKRIPEDFEVFGLGAKVKQESDLADKEGKIIQLFLVVANKTVPAIVTTNNSQAKIDGIDLMFMTCSQDCAESLRDALKKEKDLIGNISIN
ncbi:MAG: hypothetical protein JRI46_08865 [Deltaproteobacteria bacterium]|nr:hypothetical protein [Deltaproteobacteria bacterium]